jgi:hypothetical protein
VRRNLYLENQDHSRDHWSLESHSASNKRSRVSRGAGGKYRIRAIAPVSAAISFSRLSCSLPRWHLPASGAEGRPTSSVVRTISE